jgi:hypothetical protein
MKFKVWVHYSGDKAFYVEADTQKEAEDKIEEDADYGMNDMENLQYEVSHEYTEVIED